MVRAALEIVGLGAVAVVIVLGCLVAYKIITGGLPKKWGGKGE